MGKRFCHIVKAGVLAMVLSVFMTSCAYAGQTVGAAAEKKAGWLVYWDLPAGERDMEKISGKLGKVCYFGAYFDEDDSLFIPAELAEKRKQIKRKGGKYQSYLTFVNDKKNPDGSMKMKDTEVLRRIFSDEALVEKHLGEMVSLTAAGGYDGIEIDYERAWKDELVWQPFLQFCDKLYARALKRGLALRIVLEPGTPFADTHFPQGPEYVVMLYNLHGLHNGPGPKADTAFIKKTIAKMKSLPGETAVAFSTGGCEWGDNAKKRFLTEGEARTLAVSHAAEETRDEESQCVVFQYDDAGVKYEVWYADARTLNYWTKVAKEQGVKKVSLWRFGGNASLDRIDL